MGSRSRPKVLVTGTMTSVRRVERIHLVAEHGGPAVAVDEAVADAGRGLQGDRHHGEQGSA